MDFYEIYKKLDFLNDSIRLQYANFIMRNFDEGRNKISIEEIILRLKADEPIEYIFNIAEFFGFKFYVNNKVLIPRKETEELVRKTIDYIKSQDANDKITLVDIGTGSGCIILSIAKKLYKEYDNIKFIGIDISQEALDVAKINCSKLGLEEKVKFKAFDFRKINFIKYKNLIVLANLPYIPNKRKLQKSVINYEPHLALFGGENGDELVIELKKKLEKLSNLKLLITEEDQGKINIINT
jgi:release factor glutamine methyltransferase